MEMTDRRVLLTGAAGGLGSHLARAFARAGARVVLTGRNESALEALARETGGEVVLADLAEPGAAGALAARAGAVDVLVNNAGIEITSAFGRLTTEEIEQMVAVNLTAPALLTHAVLPGMLERGRGAVVNVSSLAGKAGAPYNVMYTATKAGLIGFTRALRAEYHGRPVTFSVVCPGFIEEDGMYERIRPVAGDAPPLMGASPMRVLVDAIVASARDGRAERHVSHRRPVRPVFALAELAPELGERIARLAGTSAFFEKTARSRGRL